MLPSILSIADKFKLQSNPKTYGKKESMFKCPFCREDADKPKKYYLSLNTEDNVFKCWYCKKSGGVLQFEAELSGRPYNEVRSKYFGEKKNLHPAYRLSPSQLKEIGWHDKKRQNYNIFKEKKEKVLLDWKSFEHEEKVKHYAVYLLINHFPVKEQRAALYQWFKEICQQSKVDELFKAVSKQINAKNKSDWALKGEEIAKTAYEIVYDSGDFEFQNLFVNVLFILEMKKLAEGKNGDDKTSISV